MFSVAAVVEVVMENESKVCFFESDDDRMCVLCHSSSMSSNGM